MRNCKNLTSLPRCLHKCVWKLDLSGCSNLKNFPEIIGNAKELVLSQTAIEELPSSIKFLTSLVVLNMEKCERLKSISSSICELKRLKKLVLSGCTKLVKFPTLYGLCSLRELYLDDTALEEIPVDICELKCIEKLVLSGCAKLEKLPPLYGLCSLRELYLDGTALVEIPIDICELKFLEELVLSRCTKLEKLPPLYGLCSLRSLFLDDTALVEIPIDILSLSSLRTLCLENCKRLQGLPELPCQLQNLNAINCTSLETAGSTSYIAPMEEHKDERRNHYRFNYCNCINLDQKSCGNILADVQLRIEERAMANSTVSLSLFPPSLSFFLPLQAYM